MINLFIGFLSCSSLNSSGEDYCVSYFLYHTLAHLTFYVIAFQHALLPTKITFIVMLIGLGHSILAMSGYEPPEILYYIATDRSQPYVHKELKRTRHRIRT
jgi:hypothetical protein